MRKYLVNLLFFSLAAVTAASSFAQAKPAAPAAAGNIEFKNIAEVEIETKAVDGKVEKKRAPVQKAIPGTVIFYTSTFKNIGTKPAGNLVITNPVPANTTLVAASPYGEGMDIGYSADGAKTWAAADKLKVKGADGKERAAGLTDITHVKWTPKADLAPGKLGEAGFRVVVN
jgi:uncharacterized repeat protein (TIGR01451 family)